MEKRRILWAIAFGSMLAITGCGDSSSSSVSGSGGSRGDDGGDFCTSLCQACGAGQADCQRVCDAGFGQIPDGVLDSCPSQLNTLTSCFAANDCNGDVCDSDLTAWSTCVTMNIRN